MDRAKAVADGWDMSNLYIGCEPGVDLPVRTHDVKPQYTPEAMRAKIEGRVTVTAVVDADGVVREARIMDSLDTLFGLDQQALNAVRAMTFQPGKLNGQPARTLITFEMQFTLR